MTGALDAKTQGQALTIALALGRDQLLRADDPMHEARILLAYAAGLERGHLHRLEIEDFTTGLMETYLALVDRRAQGEPVSKILGYRDFWKHRFRVSRDVLDPRPDTETLIEAALAAPFDRVLDLGTGSGCILLSLLDECQDASGVGTDLSKAALSIAQENARDLGGLKRADFILSDWFENVTGQYDLIVSNPPYITADEMAGLARELAYDPARALTDGADGLTAYRAITQGAGRHLQHNGRLIVEIGHQQGGPVREMFETAGFGQIQVLPDLDGRDRVVSGVWLG